MHPTAPSPQLLAFTEYGSGPPLLLIHGLMVPGEMFETVIPQFAMRHRVIVPDLRGTGRSRGLPPPYTIAQCAEDLVRLLDSLGIVSVDVLGYSQGSIVAQQMALDHPTRCRRLVLACAYAFNMASLREQIEGRVAPLLMRFLGMRRFAELGFSRVQQVPKDQANRVVDLVADQDTEKMIIGWKEGMAFDGRKRLGEIRQPTLIIAGSKDQAVPMHHAKMLHEGIAGSRLVVMQGADHALIWAHSDEFVRVTEGFLGERTETHSG